jgi:hypothetical protein
MRKYLLALALFALTLSGCKLDTPTCAPLCGVGDKVFVNGQVAIVINNEYVGDSRSYVYRLYSRGHYFDAPEIQVQLGEHVNWDEKQPQKFSIPLKDLFNLPGMDGGDSPHLAPPAPFDLRDRTTYGNQGSTLPA